MKKFLLPLILLTNLFAKSDEIKPYQALYIYHGAAGFASGFVSNLFVKNSIASNTVGLSLGASSFIVIKNIMELECFIKKNEYDLTTDIASAGIGYAVGALTGHVLKSGVIGIKNLCSKKKV